MPSDELKKYISDMKAKGYLDETIKDHLQKNGYDEETIAEAFLPEITVQKTQSSSIYNMFNANKQSVFFAGAIILLAFVAIFAIFGLRHPKTADSIGMAYNSISSLSYADREKLCRNILSESELNDFFHGESNITIYDLSLPNKHGRWQAPTFYNENKDHNLLSMCGISYSLKLDEGTSRSDEYLSVDIIEYSSFTLADNQTLQYKIEFSNESTSVMNYENYYMIYEREKYAELTDFGDSKAFQSVLHVYNSRTETNTSYYYFVVNTGKTVVSIVWTPNILDKNSTSYQLEKFNAMTKKIYDKIMKLDVKGLPEVKAESLDFDGYTDETCGELSNGMMAYANVTILFNGEVLNPNITRKISEADAKTADCFLKNLKECKKSRILMFDGTDSNGNDVYEGDEIGNYDKKQIQIIGPSSENPEMCHVDFTGVALNYINLSSYKYENAIQNPVAALFEIMVRVLSTADTGAKITYNQPLLNDLVVVSAKDFQATDEWVSELNPPLKEKCEIAPSITCNDFTASASNNGDIVIIINNDLGMTMNLINLNISGCLSSDGNRIGTDISKNMVPYPMLVPDPISEGDSERFEFTDCSNMVKGERFKSDIILEYNTTIEGQEVYHSKKGYIEVAVQ